MRSRANGQGVQSDELRSGSSFHPFCRPFPPLNANPETIPLHAELLGDRDRPALVVMHGMLGSRRNWASMARQLSEYFAVWTLDLRNHGASGHSPEMSYPVMARDLGAFLAREAISQPLLMGHSMGGKVAMRYTVDHPESVAGLVVVDISPKAYPPRWEHEFAVLRALDLTTLASRGEAEERLASDIPDWAFRKFLTTNLVRDPASKAFVWAVNLEALQAALPQLFREGVCPPDRFAGPTLFVRGGRSRFVSADDFPRIREIFPHAVLETIAEAGHNVHFDRPEAFAECLKGWMERNKLMAS